MQNETHSRRDHLHVTNKGGYHYEEKCIITPHIMRTVGMWRY